ncbi:MAG: DinB family protein [Microcystis sp.]
MTDTLVKDILRQLRELQEGSLWFDQSLKDKLSNLTEEEVFTRPLPEVHSVAEHVSHIIEWRKEALRRFEMKRTDLMNGPDDWKDNATLGKLGWNQLKELLFESTELLIQTLEGKNDTYLATRFQDTNYNFHYIIEGILQHDLYHLGQIGVTLKLLRRS